MSTYNLDRVTFDQKLVAGNYSTHTDVVNYLVAHGVFPPPSPPNTSPVESDTTNIASVVDPTANVDIVYGDDVRVMTDPNLKGIVESTPNSYLYVSGTTDAVVSATDGTQRIYLDNYGLNGATEGNFTVYLGAGGPDGRSIIDASGQSEPLINGLSGASTGNNSLVAGTGDADLYAGAGHDTLVGGSGFDSLSALGNAGSGVLQSGSLIGGANVLGDISATNHTLYGAAGNDTLNSAGSGSDSLVSGSGAHQLLDASSSTGNDTLTATGSGTDTLKAGAGNDLLDASNNTGGSDLYSFAGANSTLLGGSSSNPSYSTDNFQVSNDTLGAAGSNQTHVDITVGATSPVDYVGFQNRSFSDGTLSGPSSSNGMTTYTMQFTDGQTVNISGTNGSGSTVYLNFTDDGSNYHTAQTLHF